MPAAATHNKKVLRKYRDAGAIGPGKAIAAEELGLHDNRSMNRYIRDGLLAREGTKYYIPEELTKTQRWVMMFGKKAAG